MKVAFLINGLPHYFTKQLELMQKKGVNIILITPNQQSRAIGKFVYQVEEQNNFLVYRTEEYLTWYKKPFMKNIYAIVKAEKPDIIVVGWPYWLGFVLNPFLLYSLKRMRTKLVFKEIPFQIAPFNKAISYYYHHPIYNEDEIFQNPHHLKNKINYLLLALVRKYAYARMDAVLAYIPDAYSIYHSYGVPSRKIFVTYNSPDTTEIFTIKDSLMKLQLPIIPFSLIHVGRLVRWKRVHLLIEAFNSVLKKYPQAHLFIVGDGPEKNNLIKQTQSLGIKENVTFCGAIYQYAELGKLFLQSQIYVLPGMGGLSLNEAMAFGKPVICSVCDGTEKVLVRDAVNGLFFKDNDVDDLAQKIIYLFDNPNLINQFGQESEKIIHNEVNLNTVIDRYLQAFEQIVAL